MASESKTLMMCIALELQPDENAVNQRTHDLLYHGMQRKAQPSSAWYSRGDSVHTTTKPLTRTLIAFVFMLSFTLALPQPASADDSAHAYVTSAAATIEATTTQLGAKIGSTRKIAGNTYKVTSNARNTAMLTKAKNTRSIAIPAAVEIAGKVYRVTAVGPKAFRTAKRLKRVRVGDNVTRIGNSAFSGCAKLTEVAGGASVQNVGAFAFSGCEALRQCAPLGSERLVKIGAYSLKNANKLKAITVKSTKLKKSSVKKALKDSAITTVKVLVGTIKANKAYAKRYTKIFTEKNCGKEVKLKGLKRRLRQSEKTEDTTLANKWKADFERLAKASGMEVCVYALDLGSGASASYRSDKKMPSASMIKLLIAETFLGQVADGKHAFDDVYVLKETDIVGGAGSLGGRGAGAKVTKREMLKLMISESDNVAANVLIDQCGIDAINEEAKRLGLACTSLERHMMDTKALEKGLNNYTCADDLGILLKMIYDKTFVNKEMSALMLECLEAQTDNRCISKGLPEGTVFAHKTGSLSTARHDGGIVESERPFIIVTLCGGKGFSEDAALKTMEQIGKAAYKDLQETS